MKAFNAAKSRLRETSCRGDQLPDVSGLAKAFLGDVITAAQRTELVTNVLVTSSDPAVEQAAYEFNASFLPERSHPPADLNHWADLNSAISDAIAYAFGSLASQLVAVVPADLAAMRSASLQSAIEIASEHTCPSLIADHDNVGTTFLAMYQTELITPQFGAHSAAAHRLSGARDISRYVAPDMRQDIDSFTDLQAALALGLGTNSTATLNAITGD